MPMPWSRNIPPPQQVSWCHQRSGVRIQTHSPDARTQGKLIQCSYAQSVNFFLNWFLSQRRTLRCINAKGRKRSILNCVIVIEQFYSQWFNSPKFCLRKKEIITVQDKRAIKLVCQGASIAAIIGRIDREEGGAVSGEMEAASFTLEPYLGVLEGDALLLLTTWN